MNLNQVIIFLWCLFKKCWCSVCMTHWHAIREIDSLKPNNAPEKVRSIGEVNIPQKIQCWTLSIPISCCDSFVPSSPELPTLCNVYANALIHACSFATLHRMWVCPRAMRIKALPGIFGCTFEKILNVRFETLNVFCSNAFVHSYALSRRKEATRFIVHVLHVWCSFVLHTCLLLFIRACFLFFFGLLALYFMDESHFS